MQRDQANHVVVQQRGRLTDRLIRPHGGRAAEQKIVWYHAELYGAVRRDA
jgi:hypothetical protein